MVTFKPIDFASWKLTLPIGRPGHPTEIARPIRSVRPWYAADLTAGELLFRAHAGGVTTSGSKYPRSELRELQRSTGKLAAWDSRSGSHQLELHARITHLPVKKPHLVCAQIHDGDDDVLQVRLEGPRLFLESDGDDLGTLDTDYPLGSPFQLRMNATRTGVVVEYWHRDFGRMPALRRPLKLTGRGWYFKAGCYLQSNTRQGDQPGAYGEVAVSRLTVRHAA